MTPLLMATSCQQLRRDVKDDVLHQPLKTDLSFTRYLLTVGENISPDMQILGTDLSPVGKLFVPGIVGSTLNVEVIFSHLYALQIL